MAQSQNRPLARIIPFASLNRKQRSAALDAAPPPVGPTLSSGAFDANRLNAAFASGSAPAPRPMRAKKPGTHEFSHRAHERYYTPETLVFTRGDPRDLSSARALAAIGFLTTLASKVLGEAIRNDLAAADLPAESLEALYRDSMDSAPLDSTERADVPVVIRELALVLEQEGVPAQKAAGEAVRVMALALAGWGYGASAGEAPLRAVAARHLLRFVAPPSGGDVPALQAQNLVSFDGGNDAIGQVFTLLDRWYLKPGSVVGVVEPVYSPYLQLICDKLKLHLVAIPTTAENGWLPTTADLAAFEEEISRLGKPLKLFCLVNPNNPTGRALDHSTAAALAQLLRRHGALVIEDAVYAEFLPPGTFHSLWAHVPDQTLLIYSLSKYYRVTGSRLGFLVVTDAANAFASGKLLGSRGEAQFKDFLELLLHTKGPGPNGTLSHTDHQAKPMQAHAVIRLLVDRESGAAFTAKLRQRWETFYHGLDLLTPEEEAVRNHPGTQPAFVPYYALVDVREWVESAAGSEGDYSRILCAIDSGNLTPEQFFVGLTKAGVAVMPAASFFADPSLHKWAFRFSVANQFLASVESATQRIVSYLASLAAAHAPPANVISMTQLAAALPSSARSRAGSVAA